MKARFNICGILCILPALPIAGRLFYLQTVRHAELAVKASRTVTGEVPEIKVRGKLLDRNGVILAESLPTYTCAVSKRDVPNKELLLAKLSSILQIPRKELDAKWNKARNFFYVKKEIDPVAYKQLKDEGRKLTGIILNMQMAYFKITKGKRIFKMAPLHHHFELSGWAEPKVTVRFWIVGIMCPEAHTTAFRLMEELRQKGIAADGGVFGQSFKSQMRGANKSGAKFALILGGDEIKKNTVALKDLTAGTQTEVAITEAASAISGRQGI